VPIPHPFHAPGQAVVLPATRMSRYPSVAYLGSIVDRLEVAAARCIVGRKDVLEQAALAAPPCQGFAVLYANGAPYRMKLRTPMLLRLRRNRSYYLQVGM
jgi:hypothetical protein